MYKYSHITDAINPKGGDAVNLSTGRRNPDESGIKALSVDRLVANELHHHHIGICGVWSHIHASARQSAKISYDMLAAHDAHGT